MVDFSKYEKDAESLNKVINVLYNKIMFVTPDEIMKEEVNISKLSSELDELDMKIIDKKSALNKEVDNKSTEEEYSEIEDKHNQTEELFYTLSKKVEILLSVLNKLYAIRVLAREPDNKKRLSKFEDMKSIELEESFQPIKLYRLKRA